jgi:hypothetical protein
MATKSVLVVTTTDDAHANHILPLLQNRGAVVERLDGDKFASMPCYMDLDTDGISPLKKCAADVVWYRRVVLPERFDETSQFVRQETEGLLNSILLEYEEVRWVNHRSSLERAKPKLHQLNTAHRFGFRTPRSIVTNQEDALLLFFEEHHGQVVAKPIQTQVIISPMKELVVGTRRLMREDLRSAVQFFPCFAQERLTLLYEMRVIAFRDQLYGFRLTPTVSADDLKQLKLSQITHEVCNLDPNTEGKIRKFMCHYGLEFGAFDFGVVDDDEPYFLELNPNGQWLWLQFMTGFDLQTPFINLLLE